MTEDFREEFVTLANLVKAAQIAAESERTILWCVEQLPALYLQLVQTYETRFSQKIVQLEQGILGELVREGKQCSASEKLAEAIAGHLRALHERHGLRSLDPKPKVIPPTRPRKSRTSRPAV